MIGTNRGGEDMAERNGYILHGRVVHGKGAGHRHGMPTANLSCDAGMELPPLGVYGGYALADGQRWIGVTNVGPRPSDDDSPAVTVETLLLDFSGDLYDRELTLELRFYLRPIRRFSGGLDEVRAQVALDAAETRRLLAAEAETPLAKAADLR